MSMNPAKKSALFEAMTEAYMKLDALVGGTAAMRAAGTSLLPQHPEESNENYKTRLNGTVLVNYYTRALDEATGYVFKKPAEISTLPAYLTPYLRDIDGAGSTFDQFAQEVLWNTLHHGVCYTVVDYPTVDAQVQTLADAQVIAARPYTFMVTAPQVLAAYSKNDNGQDWLTHFRWLSTEVVPAEDFLEESTLTVVKAFNQPERFGPITLTTYSKTDNGEWIADEPVPIIGVDEIPVTAHYGWRTGFFTGKPVLESLGDLNIAHWRSTSEQTNILSVSRVPFLHAAGDGLDTTTVSPDGVAQVNKFKVSVHAAAITPKDTTIKWIEPSGGAIKLGQDHIDYLEKKMTEISLVPETSKSGGVTATSEAIDAASAQSVLKTISVAFGQSLARTLLHFTSFLGDQTPVQITLDASFATAVDVTPANA